MMILMMIMFCSLHRWTMVGVVSFGPSSCGNKAPGVYARVDTALDWINSQIQN
jgi:secreted trypsin-like serine protease